MPQMKTKKARNHRTRQSYIYTYIYIYTCTYTQTYICTSIYIYISYTDTQIRGTAQELGNPARNAANFSVTRFVVMYSPPKNEEITIETPRTHLFEYS